MKGVLTSIELSKKFETAKIVDLHVDDMEVSTPRRGKTGPEVERISIIDVCTPRRSSFDESDDNLIKEFENPNRRPKSKSNVLQLNVGRLDTTQAEVNLMSDGEVV